MNCRDFREIADSYLSNELLVETNHEVLCHIESCRDCRELLGVRRALRMQLKRVVMNAPESQMPPGFETRVISRLREEAMRPAFSLTGFFNPAALSLVSAAILIAIVSVVLLQWPGSGVNGTDSADGRGGYQPADGLTEKVLPVERASLISMRDDAVDDHNNCALTHNLDQRPISLEEAGRQYGLAYSGFDTAVINPLKEAFGDKVKMLRAHYCLINGRWFAHVIVERRDRIVSVLMTPREDDGMIEGNAVSCKTGGDMRVACFETMQYSVFVISDLDEFENLQLARTVEGSVRQHIVKSAV